MIMHAFISEEATASESGLRLVSPADVAGSRSDASEDDCFELRVLEFPREEEITRLSRRAISQSEMALLREIVGHADAVVADSIRGGTIDAGAALAVLTEFIRGVECIDPKAAEQLATERSICAALATA